MIICFHVSLSTSEQRTVKRLSFNFGNSSVQPCIRYIADFQLRFFECKNKEAYKLSYLPKRRSLTFEFRNIQVCLDLSRTTHFTLKYLNKTQRADKGTQRLGTTGILILLKMSGSCKSKQVLHYECLSYNKVEESQLSLCFGA